MKAASLPARSRISRASAIERALRPPGSARSATRMARGNGPLTAYVVADSRRKELNVAIDASDHSCKSELRITRPVGQRVATSSAKIQRR
jgi:hypothetical protein